MTPVTAARLKIDECFKAAVSCNILSLGFKMASGKAGLGRQMTKKSIRAMQSNNKEPVKSGKKHKDYSNVLVVNNTQQKWYEIPLQIPRNEIGIDTPSELLQSLQQEAEELLLTDVTLYNAKKAKEHRSDYQWIKTVMAQGTTADKIAAHTVQVQDSPVHTLSALRNLVGMVKLGKKSECTNAMETLHELWLSDLLIPGEKLRSFNTRPVKLLSELPVLARNTCLIVWWFESCLKELYINFVQALDSLAREAIDSAKEKVIAVICKLLSENPEQEQLLLRQAVNKLGDPQQKVASKTMYCLNKVLDKHPNMQGVILDEVEKMLFRSNVGHKAQYYAICFLSQFRLHQDTGDLATNLIRVYFCFFKACIKKGDIDSRMLSVLLMGVNRAFPYAKDTLGDDLMQHINTLHRLVHLSPFNIALQTLCLLFQVAEASSAIGDRFYCALYKKILDPHLLTSSHHAAFLNLVYKAVSNDTQITRIRAFIKRLLQVAVYCSPPLACGLLYLISQLLARKKEARAVQLEHIKYVDATFEENDEEEKYADVKLEEGPGKSECFSDGVEIEAGNKMSAAVSSWVHRPIDKNKHIKDQASNKVSGYNPLHRNPLFCHADKSVYVELTSLSRHFHPTIALFATNILEEKAIEYTGDPLQDFTTARFLERFVFKNPKKLDTGAIKSRFSRSQNYQPKGMKSLAVTSKSYLNEEEKRIPCEEVYLYRYLQKKREPWLESEKEEEKEGNQDSDSDSVASDEFEELLHGGKLGGVTAGQPDFADDIGEDLNSDGDSEKSDEEHSMNQKAKKSTLVKKSGKRRRKSEDVDDYEDLPSVFAAAEEFADMLEDTGASTLDVQGSSGLANPDNAAAKQLHWEAARDQWIQGGKNKRFKNKRNNTQGNKIHSKRQKRHFK